MDHRSQPARRTPNHRTRTHRNHTRQEKYHPQVHTERTNYRMCAAHKERATIILRNANCLPRFTKQRHRKQLLHQAETQALALALPKIVMTVISVREELIAWYKRNGYQDTGAREPFPASHAHSAIAKEPLEFIVLEKKIESHIQS